jgi:hypothetical protein
MSSDIVGRVDRSAPRGLEDAQGGRPAARWYLIGSAVLGTAFLLASLSGQAASAQDDPEGICKLWNDKIASMASAGLELKHEALCGGSDEAARLFSAPESFGLLPFLRSTDRLVNNPGTDGVNSTQSETSIVQKGRILCAAWNDSGSFPPSFSGFGRSSNLGRTWTDRGPFPVGDGGDANFGDPSLAWSERDHTYYYAALSSLGLSLWKSLDHCQTFEYVGAIHVGPGDDKELMAIDNDKRDLFFGRMYVGWTSFDLTPNDSLQVSYSDDGGTTWSTPATLPGSGSAASLGMWPAIAPNGDVFFAFVTRGIPLQSQRIYKSIDGGNTWSEVTPIAADQRTPLDPTATTACGRQALNGNIRFLSSPQIAIHRSLFAPAGYVVHAVYAYDSDGVGPDQSNVFYRRSTDGGSTWSGEVQLNDDDTDTDQFFPAIGVDPLGRVVVSWYDRRLDPVDNLLFDRFAVVSLTGGLGWAPNVRVSDVSSPVAQINPQFDPVVATCYHGDYDQLTVDLLGANIIWSDDRRMTASGPNPDVFFDRRSLFFLLTHGAAQVAKAGG